MLFVAPTTVQFVYPPFAAVMTALVAKHNLKGVILKVVPAQVRVASQPPTYEVCSESELYIIQFLLFHCPLFPLGQTDPSFAFLWTCFPVFRIYVDTHSLKVVSVLLSLFHNSLRLKINDSKKKSKLSVVIIVKSGFGGSFKIEWNVQSLRLYSRVASKQWQLSSLYNKGI